MIDRGQSSTVDLQTLYNTAADYTAAPAAATDIGSRLDQFSTLLDQKLDAAQFDTVHAPGAPGVSTETYTTASDAALQHHDTSTTPTGNT